MALRREILAWCDETLQVWLFKDYAPNGLQVEGKEEIAKIATSVTASKAAIDFAVGQGGGYAFGSPRHVLEKRACHDYRLEKSTH